MERKIAVLHAGLDKLQQVRHVTLQPSGSLLLLKACGKVMRVMSITYREREHDDLRVLTPQLSSQRFDRILTPVR